VNRLPADRRDAILLIGPTGSGKSPLGECLQTEGLHGRRCHHFDFGAELRAAAGGAPCPGLSDADRTFIRRCLNEGALLEHDTFHIAEALFRGFTDRRGVASDDLVVMNGLPRHADQADDVERLVRVSLVVVLDCDAATVAARIALDTGGDRRGRTDDQPEAVRRKMALFAERTRPLIEHYRRQGARITTVPVGVATRPCEVLERLHSATAETLSCR
jgi:adenylate kinase family enzyme